MSGGVDTHVRSRWHRCRGSPLSQCLVMWTSWVSSAVRVVFPPLYASARQPVICSHIRWGVINRRGHGRENPPARGLPTPRARTTAPAFWPRLRDRMGPRPHMVLSFPRLWLDLRTIIPECRGALTATTAVDPRGAGRTMLLNSRQYNHLKVGTCWCFLQQHGRHARGSRYDEL